MNARSAFNADENTHYTVITILQYFNTCISVRSSGLKKLMKIGWIFRSSTRDVQVLFFRGVVRVLLQRRGGGAESRHKCLYSVQSHTLSSILIKLSWN